MATGAARGAAAFANNRFSTRPTATLSAQSTTLATPMSWSLNSLSNYVNAHIPALAFVPEDADGAVEPEFGWGFPTVFVFAVVVPTPAVAEAADPAALDAGPGPDPADVPAGPAAHAGAEAVVGEVGTAAGLGFMDPAPEAGGMEDAAGEMMAGETEAMADPSIADPGPRIPAEAEAMPVTNVDPTAGGFDAAAAPTEDETAVAAAAAASAAAAATVAAAAAATAAAAVATASAATAAAAATATAAAAAASTAAAALAPGVGATGADAEEALASAQARAVNHAVAARVGSTALATATVPADEGYDVTHQAPDPAGEADSGSQPLQHAATAGSSFKAEAERAPPTLNAVSFASRAANPAQK